MKRIARARISRACLFGGDDETLVRNVAGPASAVVDLLAAEDISAEANADGSVTDL